MLRLRLGKDYQLCASLKCPGGIVYRLALRVPSLVDGLIADEFTDVLGTGVLGRGKRVHLQGVLVVEVWIICASG